METQCAKRRKLNDMTKKSEYTNNIITDIETNLFNDLNNMGYHIMKDEIELSDDIIKYIVKKGNKNNSYIFNHNEKSKSNDRKRTQTSFCTKKSKNDYPKKFINKINNKITKLFPHLIPNDWVILLLIPNQDVKIKPLIQIIFRLMK